MDNNFKTVKLKVLLKEESFEVSCADNATVLRLKHAIASQSEIPIIQQRLIFSGRQLKPDEKFLTDRKLCLSSSQKKCKLLNNYTKIRSQNYQILPKYLIHSMSSVVK